MHSRKAPSLKLALSTTFNFQPAILIKVGDGQTTRFEDAPAPKAGHGVLLDGNGNLVRER